MNELIANILDAHGGLDRWNEYQRVEATIVSGGGFFPLKGVPQDSSPRRMTVWLHEERSSVFPYGAPDQRTMFTPEQIAIEKLDGTLVAERFAPRDSFAGHQMNTPWDALHRAYFNGEALWTYLTTPFLLAMDGMRVEETDAWREGVETWRVLRAYFPGSIETHSLVQDFFFGEDLLLRRHDYSVNIAGGFGAAQLTSDYVTANGVRLPTKRRAYTRGPDRRPILDRRRFFSAAAMTIAASQFGKIGSADAQSGKTNLTDLPAIKPGTNTSFDSLKQIDAGLLNVSYAEAGPASGPAVILLHGWPYDIHSYADVAPLLASKGYRVIVPYLRGYGATRFLSNETIRNGQQSALAVDIIALMDALKIEKAIIGGFDWGARTANIMAALWPERSKALVSVSGYLIGNREANKMPLPPKAELEWWYQFYFATDRGRAGYEKYRHEFNKLIWQLASPKWNFDDVTFDRSAASFNNPDHVSIVIHNYRWRIGLAEGERKYDELEKRLAEAPVITVPSITLEGDANGAPHPDASSYAKKFSGKYAHRIIKGGVGHNLPQEAPQAFAQAVIDVGGF